MSTMQVEVYEAFRSLDVPDDKALRAAVVLGKQGDELAALRADMDKGFTKAEADRAAIKADMDRRMAGLVGDMDRRMAGLVGDIDKRMATLVGDMDKRMATLVGDMNLLKWMMGTLIAGVVTVIFRVFAH